MIQRIQSVWLLLSSILSVLCFFVPFSWRAKEQGIQEGHYIQNHWYLLILVLLVTLSCFANIFLYHDRSLQKKVALGSIITQGLILIIVVFEFFNFPLNGPALSSLVHFAVFVSIFLALKGIKKDIQTVSESDRLR